MDRLNNKQLAYKNLDEALSLDMMNNHKGAFQQYLRSLSSVCDALLEETNKTEFRDNNHTKNRKKLLNLAKQCMERIEFLSDELDQQNDADQSSEKSEFSQSLKKDSDSEKNEKICKIVPNETLEGSLMGSRSCNNSSLLNVPVTYLEMVPIETLNCISARPKEPTPLELVHRANQQLMAAYRARLARTQNVGAQTNLHLSLQRRMAENVTLAWAKQKVVIQRNQERQQRLLDQATRRIKRISRINSKEEEANKQLFVQILEYEQEELWPIHLKESLKTNPKNYALIDYIVKQTLSMQNHPLCLLMSKLQYEIYDKIHHLLLLQREFCKNPPYEEKSLSEKEVNLMQETNDAVPRNDGLQISLTVLNTNANNDEWEKTTKAHVITEKNTAEDLWNDKNKLVDDLELKKENEDKNYFQNCMDNNILTKDYQKNVTRNGFKECCNIKLMEEEALKNHLSVIVLDVQSAVDRILNMLLLTYEQLNSAEGKDQCYSSMEELFFKPVWPYLIQLFRLVYEKEEALMAQIMTESKDITLKELGVPENFWSNEPYPYYEAIEEIKNIINCLGPLKKLDVMVQVARLICENSNKPATSNSMGADDLISILCFVVIKSGLPELISECHAMEQFIQEGYLMGEEGYCLTSLTTAFQYLATRSQELNKMLEPTERISTCDILN